MGKIMDFFDKLGQKASEAYKVTADKTGKLAKETKLKFKMSDLKNQISDIYEEIGKIIYQQHIREENIDIEKQIEEKCTKIDVLSDEIESINKECMELKNKRQCPKCQTQIDKEVKFCPECGEPQTSEPEKEVEQLERLENTEVKPEKEDQKQIIEENLKEKIENSNSKENKQNETADQDEELEQKEENTEKDSENEEQNNLEEQEDDEEEKDNLQKTVEIESDVNLDE